MKILVTGCAGFIGSKVSELLLDTGSSVTGVDNLNDCYSSQLKLWRLDRLRKRSNFEFRKTDISSLEAIRDLFRSGGFDAAINLAARVGVRASIEDPFIYYDTNVRGTLNLLECCAKFGTPKFLQASSSSVYGAIAVPFRETDPTDQVLSPYAASKKSAEVLAHSFHHIYGIDVTVLRFFTVYGPAGRPDMAYFKFISSICKGEPVQIFGDGRQKRDFTYIDDIADGVLRGLRSVGFEAINLGNSSPVEILTVVEMIERLIQKKARLVFLPTQNADAPTTWACIDKANSILGWKPTVDIATGIEATVEWHLEHERDLV